VKLTCNIDAIVKAAEIVGSYKLLAEKIGVSYQCVMAWKQGKTSPNVLNCLKIEKACDKKITRKDIFPNHPWGDDQD
jgi:DNA-binding transcriptional regulator YdaS (Cro superfamily)